MLAYVIYFLYLCTQNVQEWKLTLARGTQTTSPWFET